MACIESEDRQNTSEHVRVGVFAGNFRNRAQHFRRGITSAATDDSHISQRDALHTASLDARD